MVVTERGQAHTLEAVVAGLLLLSSVIFALQMTAVTPLSASTSSQHIENQQRSVARGVLASAAEQDALKPTVLYWNNSSSEFYGYTENSRPDYAGKTPNTTFGEMLNRTFNQRGISYNVYLEYRAKNSDRQTNRQFIYNGVPSDNAVVAARTVTLMDQEPLYTENETQMHNLTVSDVNGYPIQDIDGPVYNVVRVEVVVWRI